MCIEKQQVEGRSFRSHTKLKFQPEIASGVLVQVYSCCARILSNRLETTQPWRKKEDQCCLRRLRWWSDGQVYSKNKIRLETLLASRYEARSITQVSTPAKLRDERAIFPELPLPGS